MKIRMVKIGKPGRPEIVSLVSDYHKRLRSFIKVETLDYKDVPPREDSSTAPKRDGKRDPVAIIDDLKRSRSDFVIVLDERGKHFSSPDLAKFIQMKIDDREIKSLSFVVGGPYGLGNLARKRSDLVWSVSSGVFPSDIAWLLLWEQVYRSFNIIKGTPYHHV